MSTIEKLVSSSMLTVLLALHVAASSFAIVAARRPNGRVAPNELDHLVLCVYDIDPASRIYILMACGLLLISHTMFNVVTHFYFARRNINRTCCSTSLVWFLVISSWTSFVVAEIILGVCGSGISLTYPSYIGAFDLYCQRFRRYYLQTSAVFILFSLVFSIFSYSAQLKTKAAGGLFMERVVRALA